MTDGAAQQIMISETDPWLLLAEGAPRSLALAAASAFGELGFQGTTTRDIATRAGMSAAGLYVHYASKEELLYVIATIGHQAAVNTLEAAMHGLRDPAQRVHALVTAFTAWHAENRSLAKVLQYELRNLKPEHLVLISGIRRATETRARKEVARLAGPKIDIKVTTRAILSLGIDVARWYDPKKNAPPSVLGKQYADLVFRMLGLTAKSMQLREGVLPRAGGRVRTLQRKTSLVAQ